MLVFAIQEWNYGSIYWEALDKCYSKHRTDTTVHTLFLIMLASGM